MFVIIGIGFMIYRSQVVQEYVSINMGLEVIIRKVFMGKYDQWEEFLLFSVNVFNFLNVSVSLFVVMFIIVVDGWSDYIFILLGGGGKVKVFGRFSS